MSFREPLIKQLRRDEGEILHAYEDHLGFWTIGVGRLIDKRRGGGISEEESAYLLNNDITRVTQGLRRRLAWFDELDPARKGVLLNMAFQMGVEGLLGFTNTLKLVEEGNYTAAAKAMMESKWATQTPARALRLAKQMETGEWQ